MNIDVSAKPFFLEMEDIDWVQDTLASMSIEEKIGQLFFLMGMSGGPGELRSLIERIHPGGMMYRKTSASGLTKAYRALQDNAHIPLFLAANLEAGGNGLLDEGTFFGHPMLIAATDDPEHARRLGVVCAREAKSVGGNMAFAPVVDINFNFRNPVTNIRSYGDDPERVAKMSAAYVKGAMVEGLSVTIKHFPGDGADARDQHLLTTVNNLGYSDWMATYGRVYRDCIDGGANGLMAGHISLPGYFDATDCDQKLRDIPATLNSVLLNDLLRRELGYNGLIISDATLMAGFAQQGKRADLVPRSIAAGIDMFLFTRNPDEDYSFMLQGFRDGVISSERLNDAVTRILALKAQLGLHKKSKQDLVPNAFSKVNTTEHRQWANEVADAGVTLVSDDQCLLPIEPAKYRRIGIIYNGNESMEKTMFKNMRGLAGIMLKLIQLFSPKEQSATEKLVALLKEKGFQAFEYDFGNLLAVMRDMNNPIEQWVGQFDLVIYLTKKETMSNQTSLQLEYKAMGFDAPWFVHEVPTIHVSLGNPYQLYDLSMVGTVINGYSPTDEVLSQLVDKLMGASEFRGVSPVDLSCREFTGSLN